MNLRTLDRYIALRFIAIYLASLTSFLVIFVLVDSFSQYSALMNKSEGFGSFFLLWLKYYAAQLPLIFSQALGPVTAAASASFTVTMFLRANEFTPILGSGVSLQRQLAPILVLTLLAVAGSALVQEIWIPANQDWMLEAKAMGRGRAHIRHAKHYDPKHDILAVFRYYNFRDLEGDGVLIMPLDRRFLIEARNARWRDHPREPGKAWILEDGFIQKYDEAGNLIPQGAPFPARLESQQKAPHAEPAAGRLLKTFQTMLLEDMEELEEFDLKPHDLRHQSKDFYRWIGELIEEVERAPRSNQWRIRLYSRLIDPLHAIILVLLGIPAIFLWGTRNIFLSAIAVMIISSLYFITYLILLNMGNRGTLPPSLAAGLAPVFYGSLGITLYAKMRS